MAGNELGRNSFIGSVYSAPFFGLQTAIRSRAIRDGSAKLRLDRNYAALLLSSFLFPDFARRRHAHHSVLVTIQAVRKILHLAAFVLRADRKSSVRSASFDPHGQIAFQIRTAISGVVILIVLFVTENVDAIKIRFVESVRIFS